LTLQLRK